MDDNGGQLDKTTLLTKPDSANPLEIARRLVIFYGNGPRFELSMKKTTKTRNMDMMVIFWLPESCVVLWYGGNDETVDVRNGRSLSMSLYHLTYLLDTLSHQSICHRH